MTEHSIRSEAGPTPGHRPPALSRRSTLAWCLGTLLLPGLLDHVTYDGSRFDTIGLIGAGLIAVGWALASQPRRARLESGILLAVALVWLLTIHRAALVPEVLGVLAWARLNSMRRKADVAGTVTVAILVFLRAVILPAVLPPVDWADPQGGTIFHAFIWGELFGGALVAWIVDGGWSRRQVRASHESRTDAAGIALLVGAGSWSLVRWAFAVAGVVLIVSGFVFSRSDSFKVACGIHKETGASIGTVKNLICDADFTTGSGG